MSNLIKNCGWTISNRRMLKSVIGSAEMEKLAETYKKLCQPGNDLCKFNFEIPELSDDVYKVALSRFRRQLFTFCSDGKNIWLKLGVDIKGSKADIPDIKFINSEITVDNIKKGLIKLKESVIENMKKVKSVDRSSIEKSKTLERLFSKEFTVPPQINEDGYYVTTIIDRKNNQPVLAYIKELHKRGECTDDRKTWGLFIQHVNGCYEILGKTSYKINDAERKFTAGWMDSYGGQREYAGIGARLHEWRIAQAIKAGYNKIEIEALDEAFPFHYKCGYRHQNTWEEYTIPEFDKLFTLISKNTGMSSEEIEKFLIKKYLPDDRVLLNTKSRENILIETLCKSGNAKCDQESTMIMEGKNLEQWLQRMDIQPILPE